MGLQSITAIALLKQRGLTLSRAKQTIEAMMEFGHTLVSLPAGNDAAVLIADLAQAGVTARIANAEIDPSSLATVTTV